MKESKEKGTNFAVINDRISEGIKKTATASALDRVVDKRVEIEAARRAEILEKGLDMYNETCKKLAACVPDNKTYLVVKDDKSGDGGAAIEQSSYSEKKWKELKALQETKAKLELAIMKATEEDDFTKLQQLSSNSKPQNNQKPGETTE